MDKLDDYLELLYEGTGKSEKEKEEGLQAQLHGTGMILKLCRDVMNLEQLIQNATIMGALTRVLQEDFKKSAELTFTILKIFLSFSNFLEMHTLMANYRLIARTFLSLLSLFPTFFSLPILSLLLHFFFFFSLSLFFFVFSSSICIFSLFLAIDPSLHFPFFLLFSSFLSHTLSLTHFFIYM